MRLAVIVEVPFVVCRIASNERQLYFLPWFSDGATLACQWTSSRAREAGLHSFCAILWKYNLQFFLKQNAERVLRWEKLKLYLPKWHAVQWISEVSEI